MCRAVCVCVVSLCDSEDGRDSMVGTFPVAVTEPRLDCLLL